MKDDIHEKKCILKGIRLVSSREEIYFQIKENRMRTVFMVGVS